MAEPAKESPVFRVWGSTECVTGNSKTKGHTTAPLNFALYAALEKVASELSFVAGAVCAVIALLCLVLTACVLAGVFTGFDEGIWALSILWGMVLGLCLARFVVLEKVRG